MKKLIFFASILLLISGCDSGSKELVCNSKSTANGIVTDTKYEVEYDGENVKFVTITYDYKSVNGNNKDVDGTNADTDGITNNDVDNNDSDEVIDGVVGDTIDSTIDTVTDTILDLSGIKNKYENQMSSYDGISGFSYDVDIDNDNEYKVIYKVDLDKISDTDLARFDIDKNFDDFKSSYEDLGYTCK